MKKKKMKNKKKKQKRNNEIDFNFMDILKKYHASQD